VSDAALSNCLSELASLGLSQIGAAQDLLQSCGDENPLLDLLAEPSRLPKGRNRQLLEERRLGTRSSPGLELLEDVFSSIRQHARRIWHLAVGYAHACLHQGGHCDSRPVLAESLREAQRLFLASSASLVHKALSYTSRGRQPSLVGLGELGTVTARHAFNARHLDFAQSVLNGLRVMEPLQAVGALHDLALRVATSNCELQAELLASMTVTELLAPELAAKIGAPGFPRFEYHAGACCRRYHVLTSILEPMVQENARAGKGPLRILEVGVNNALTSEYLLSKMADVQFDGVDPYFDADDIHLEAVTRLQRFGERARLWRKTSEDAAAMFAPGTFDLVFIDGDHSREAVVGDIRAWRAKVRPGGLLAGHDMFNLAFEGVLEAVVEEIGLRSVNGETETIHFAPDFVWWLQA
ncbi:unnamed protein product, partial [Polarella glacialis]